MKKIAVVAGAVALAFTVGVAGADTVRIFAYDAKGKLTKEGKFSKSTRVYSTGDIRKLKSTTRKRYRVNMTLCRKHFHLRSIQKKWIAAHKKAKHRLVLRRRVGKHKFRKLCTL